MIDDGDGDDGGGTREQDEQEEQEEEGGEMIPIFTTLTKRQLQVVESCFKGEDFLPRVSEWYSRQFVSFLKRASMLAMDKLEIGILFAMWKGVDDAFSTTLYDVLRSTQGSAWSEERSAWTEAYRTVRDAMLVNGCTPSPRMCVALAYMYTLIIPKGLVQRHLKALCPPPLLVCMFHNTGHSALINGDFMIANVTPKTRAEHGDRRLFGEAFADPNPPLASLCVRVEQNGHDRQRDWHTTSLSTVYDTNSYVKYNVPARNAPKRYTVVHKGQDVVEFVQEGDLKVTYSSSGSTVALSYAIERVWRSDTGLGVRFINLQTRQTRLFEDATFPNIRGRTNLVRQATETTACVVALEDYMVVMPMVGVPVRVPLAPAHIVHAVAIHGQVVAAVITDTPDDTPVSINTFNAASGNILDRVPLLGYDLATNVLQFTPDGTSLVGVSRTNQYLTVWSTAVETNGRIADGIWYSSPVRTDTYGRAHAYEHRLAYLTDSHVAVYRKRQHEQRYEHEQRYDLVVFRLDNHMYEIVKLGFKRVCRWMAPQATDYYQSYGGRLLFDLNPGIEDEDDDEG